MPRPKTSKHGDFSYYTNYKCRCAKCREANKLYWRRRRAQAAILRDLGRDD